MHHDGLFSSVLRLPNFACPSGTLELAQLQFCAIEHEIFTAYPSDQAYPSDRDSALSVDENVYCISEPSGTLRRARFAVFILLFRYAHKRDTLLIHFIFKQILHKYHLIHFNYLCVVVISS